MTGGINPKGRLYIDRPGKTKPQRCIFRAFTGMPQEDACSDNCPHFDEPVMDGGNTTLTLCLNRKLVFSNFSDERGMK
jgi:hypothetical protein